MRKLVATIAVVILLTGCSGSPTPTEISDVRAALEASLYKLAVAIEREDPILASQVASERFVMGDNIAVRYSDDGWSGEGIGAFRSFFDGVFTVHANISQTFELRDVEQVGDVATARVYNELVSSRTDRTPPEGYVAAGWDWFIFERVGKNWLLINWDEASNPAEHEMGDGEDL
ncbi:hypothetical protein JW859_00040 [bacterium]|nr:hypothetical protein [bacterium]